MVVLAKPAQSWEPSITGAAAAAALAIPSVVVMAVSAAAAAEPFAHRLAAVPLLTPVQLEVSQEFTAVVVVRLTFPAVMAAPALAAVAVAARIIIALIKAATAALVLWLCAQLHQ